MMIFSLLGLHPYTCLPRAHPFSLSPTTSKRLLRRLLYKLLIFPLLTNQKTHYFIFYCHFNDCQKIDIMEVAQSIGHLGYFMFDMRSVFHRAKTLSTVVTKQVSYQIFICIFFLRVTSPRMGIRLWGTEGRLCLQSHIHTNTSSTRLLNKTNNCYLFSIFNLFFQTPCHQFYRIEPVI